MSEHVSSVDRMIADLKATFPGIHARPLADFIPDWGQGVWSGGEALMPDGLPIFRYYYTDSDEYEGTVHVGFLAWLERRGWYSEAYDYGTHFLIPIGQPLIPLS